MRTLEATDMSSDQEGFKVPSLPISRTKPNVDSGGDETTQQTTQSEPSLTPDDTVTTQETKDATKDNDSEITEQVKSTSEGKNCIAGT